MNIGKIPAKYARLTPHNTAIVDAVQNKRLTFAEFDEAVRRAANALLGLGAQNGDRVAVIASNTAEHMILFFACSRAGLIIQSVNWRLAAEELARILNDSEPVIVISEDRFAQVASALQGQVMAPHAWLLFGAQGNGSYERLVAGSSASEPEPRQPVTPQDPNYILYTGGTTGESKGALHSHESTLNAIINNAVGEHITSDCVYMLTGQMFHSTAILAVSYFSHGCTIVMMNFEPRQAMELIHRERVTNFIGITTMINWMMALENFDDYDISSIRHIMYGGGPLPEPVLRQALEKFGCNFLGCFGQTEGNTMAYLGYKAHTEALAGIHPERLTSCGREAWLSTIEIRDESGAVIPPGSGAVGEIYTKSPSTMLRYWRRPELTAEALQDGWLKTGDLARWDAERHLFIVDRAKDMIISGGENIYSSQVESAIHQCPAVLEAAVIGIPDEEWGEIVAAYVVLKPGSTATEREIIDMGAKHLASYQKPRLVRFIDALPKAPTGKILKRELRQLFHTIESPEKVS